MRISLPAYSLKSRVSLAHTGIRLYPADENGLAARLASFGSTYGLSVRTVMKLPPFCEIWIRIRSKPLLFGFTDSISHQVCKSRCGLVAVVRSITGEVSVPWFDVL